MNTSTTDIELQAFSPNAQQKKLGLILLLCFAFLAFFLPTLGPLTKPSEARYARTSQDLYQRGDWLVPYYDGSPRIKKPPLLHWVHKAPLAVFGEKSMFAVRLTSMLGWSLTVLIVFWMGWKIRDGATGLIAAALFSTAALPLTISRMVLIDPVMLPFWALATFAGYLAFFKQPGEEENEGGAQYSLKWLIVFWVCLAVNFAFKGPQAWVPILPLFVWLSLSPRRDLLLKPGVVLVTILGLIISVAPLLGWALAVMEHFPEAKRIWYEESIGRMLGTTPSEKTHGGRFLGYNWLLMLVGFLPALIFLPIPGIHVKKLHWGKQRREAGLGLYLFISVMLPLVFYSLFRMRAPNYLMMFAPMMALGGAIVVRPWLDVKASHQALKEQGVDTGRLYPDPMMLLCFATAPLLMPVLALKAHFKGERAKAFLMVGYSLWVICLGAIIATVVFSMPQDTRVFVDYLDQKHPEGDYELYSFGDTYHDASFYRGQDVIRWSHPINELPELKPGQTRYILMQYGQREFYDKKMYSTEKFELMQHDSFEGRKNVLYQQKY